MEQIFFKNLVSLNHGSDFYLNFYEPEPMARISTKNISEPEHGSKIYNNIT